eukprot:COSAG02_NODE_5561_length_4228_cov_309.315331_4_plen_81_part_00
MHCISQLFFLTPNDSNAACDILLIVVIKSDFNAAGLSIVDNISSMTSTVSSRHRRTTTSRIPMISLYNDKGLSREIPKSL